MIDLNRVWGINEHIRFRRLLDEGVMIHQEQAEALVLNDTGMLFIELCDGKRTTAEIIAEMCAQFSVKEEQLSQDLAPFINELSESGVLNHVRGASE